MWGAIIGGGVLILILGYVIVVYNGLVSRKVENDNAWSQINVQLQRRHDLIPNLVETVKGYAKHEQQTLEKVIQARNQAVNAGSIADKSVAETQLTTAVRGLLAIAEAYPTSRRIRISRAQEIDGHRNHRLLVSITTTWSGSTTRHMKFPSNVVGGMLGFRPADFFTLDPAQAAAVKEAPKVQF